MTNSLIKKMSDGLGLRGNRETFLAPFEEQFNQIMNDFFEKDGILSVKSKVNFPKTDIYVKDNKFFVEVSVSAYSPEDLNVEMTPDKRSGKTILKVSGKSSGEEYKEASYYVKEMRRSAFERSFLLPDHIEGDPEATVKDGMLTLSWSLPKLDEAKPEVKKIEIKKAD